MPDYKVKQPLKFGDDDIEIGGTVTMSAKQAESLLEIDVLEPLPKAGATTETQKPDGEALNVAILEAVAGLDTADEELWTQTAGVPQTAALSRALGYAVTASERDAALASSENDGAAE